MKKFLLILLGLFLLVAVLILRPVPILPEDECLVQTGLVTNIYEGGVMDMCINIEENDVTYYINRGLENGLDLDEMREKLIGQNVVMKYPSYWTPLDWDDKIKHISKLEIGDEVLFDETRK